MKKILLGSIVSVMMLSGVSSAEEDKPGVSDLVEPRPPSTVTATNVGSVVSTTTEQKGMVVKEDEELIIKEPTTASRVNTPTSALPPAKISDPNLDLEQTMELMEDNFKALKKADSTAEMVKPLEELRVFASQAHALSPTMYEAMRVDFEMGIEKLRINLEELEAAVDAEDLQEAQKIIKEINDNRKKSHEYFDVD